MKVRAIQYVVLVGVAAVFLGPLYWLLSTAFKQPTEIHVVDELPKTVTGKVAKGRLRERRHQRTLGLLE